MSAALLKHALVTIVSILARCNLHVEKMLSARQRVTELSAIVLPNGQEIQRQNVTNVKPFKSVKVRPSY